MGGLFIAAEAVSQSPGPPRLCPPTSPPRMRRGRSLGDCGGTTWRTSCPRLQGAQTKTQRPRPHSSRRLCGRRATKRSDWRGGRAGSSTRAALAADAFALLVRWCTCPPGRRPKQTMSAYASSLSAPGSASRRPWFFSTAVWGQRRTQPALGSRFLYVQRVLVTDRSRMHC